MQKSIEFVFIVCIYMVLGLTTFYWTTNKGFIPGHRLPVVLSQGVGPHDISPLLYDISISISIIFVPVLCSHL